jgi:hypothetical protein
MARPSLHVCYWGNSGRHLLAANISPFDPQLIFSLAERQTGRDDLRFPGKTGSPRQSGEPTRLTAPDIH